MNPDCACMQSQAEEVVCVSASNAEDRRKKLKVASRRCGQSCLNTRLCPCRSAGADIYEVTAGAPRLRSWRCNRCDEQCEDHCCGSVHIIAVKLRESWANRLDSCPEELFIATGHAGWRESNEGSNQYAMCLFSLLAERSALPSSGIIYLLAFGAVEDREHLRRTNSYLLLWFTPGRSLLTRPVS